MADKKHALAELLLRRKELQQKVNQLQQINRSELFENRVRRVKVTDAVDEVVADVAKLTASQVTAEYDFYAGALRRCDAAIQKANWDTQVAIDADVMSNYVPKK